MFEFRATLFIFLLPCVKDEDAREKIICDRYNTTSTTDKLVKLKDNRVAENYPKSPHIIDCAVMDSMIPNGNFLTYFEYNYILTCDESHTIPLGSSDKWNCSTSVADNNTSMKHLLRENDPNFKYGAYECVEKVWPNSIYIEQRVFVHNTVDCILSQNEYMKELEEIAEMYPKLLVWDVEFMLRFVPEQTECYSVFNNSNVFSELITALTFQLVHETKYQIIPNSILDIASCQLKKQIHDVLERLSYKEGRLTYYFEKRDAKFYPELCKKGWMVEKEFISGFTNEVPMCRPCQRGYYLNVEQGHCARCGNYEYTNVHGATRCTICFNVYIGYQEENWDSLLDCFRGFEPRMWSALSRGFVFITLFHLFYGSILIWNVRWTMHLKKTKSDLLEESLSTGV